MNRQRRRTQLTPRYGRSTEHQIQHALKKPRGFEPGMVRSKANDKQRTAFINQLLARKQDEKARARATARESRP